MTYPEEKDIQLHKDKVFQMMLLYFYPWKNAHKETKTNATIMQKSDVENAIRCLMGDAALWVHEKHGPIDLEKAKKLITSLTLHVEEDI